MTKPTRRRRAKKRRPDFFLKNKWLLLVMGGAGLLVVCLVWLARMEERPQPSAVPPPEVTQAPDYTQKVRTEVEVFLAGLKTDAGKIQRDLDYEPARYTVSGEFPPADLIAAFRERIRRFPGDYNVRLREANSLTVEKSRVTQIIILFIPPAPAVPAGPLLAIIMDDLGRSLQTAKVLASLAQPVTFAILPDEPQAVQVAELAHAAGREVMLHVPMEPQGYPAVNPGPDALFINESDAEIRGNFDKLLARIPYVVGTNNHMGSRFTEDARALAPVMESLREKGLFFIDSRTTGHSRVPEVASRFGVPTMNRDVFLDNVAEVEAIAREIRRLEGKARRGGMAIGICHPYPETLDALKRELPGLAERGVTVVPVSLLLQHKLASRQGS
jgi:polysaccharide deacetylase 2 family uncharacterized protein YibQ